MVHGFIFVILLEAAFLYGNAKGIKDYTKKLTDYVEEFDIIKEKLHIIIDCRNIEIKRLERIIKEKCS